MKHKGERHIPDFSKKPAAQSRIPDQKAPPPSHTPPPQVKPQGKSAKSGRRGQ